MLTDGVWGCMGLCWAASRLRLANLSVVDVVDKSRHEYSVFGFGFRLLVFGFWFLGNGGNWQQLGSNDIVMAPFY